MLASGLRATAAVPRARLHGPRTRALCVCATPEGKSNVVKEAVEAAEAATMAAPSRDEADKAVKDIASKFAPRASGNTGKNPAVKGSVLYDIFTYQAWICLALGGLLSYNVLFPSNEPDIWRLMGMWSVWMFTIPSLRARDCEPDEKEWLNYAFLAVPLINVALPFIWKNFAFVYTADLAALAGLYYWKISLPAQQAEGKP